MLELPDIAAYMSALEPRIVGQSIQIRLVSPFLLRSSAAAFSVNVKATIFEGLPEIRSLPGFR